MQYPVTTPIVPSIRNADGSLCFNPEAIENSLPIPQDIESPERSHWYEDNLDRLEVSSESSEEVCCTTIPCGNKPIKVIPVWCSMMNAETSSGSGEEFVKSSGDNDSSSDGASTPERDIFLESKGVQLCRKIIRDSDKGGYVTVIHKSVTPQKPSYPVVSVFGGNSSSSDESESSSERICRNMSRSPDRATSLKTVVKGIPVYISCPSEESSESGDSEEVFDARDRTSSDVILAIANSLGPRTKKVSPGEFMSKLLSDGVYLPCTYDCSYVIECCLAYVNGYDKDVIEDVVSYMACDRLVTTKKNYSVILRGLLEYFFKMFKTVASTILGGSKSRYSYQRAIKTNPIFNEHVESVMVEHANKHVVCFNKADAAIFTMINIIKKSLKTEEIYGFIHMLIHGIPDVKCIKNVTMNSVSYNKEFVKSVSIGAFICAYKEITSHKLSKEEITEYKRLCR